ncbi:MAG: isoprenylcysteine carboxylmethyltransferase family protein [Lachnospiraceae bacterium]|nr:isoprenylcysteine carboxylmethyltransferase family protein [Lachnospiraceae bacterium]
MKSRMKDYVKEEQKLPLYGIGPYLVMVLGLVCAIFIVLFVYVFKAGNLTGIWIWIFRITGVLFMAGGLVIWFIGALRSGMDESISDNKLKTDGIYAWVRNPMYSGWWLLFTGISFMWHNVFMIPAFLINWLIMTVVLKNTEEKWLLKTYGDKYEEYKNSVNRCIPWKRKA